MEKLAISYQKELIFSSDCSTKKPEQAVDQFYQQHDRRMNKAAEEITMEMDCQKVLKFYVFNFSVKEKG